MTTFAYPYRLGVALDPNLLVDGTSPLPIPYRIQPSLVPRLVPPNQTVPVTASTMPALVPRTPAPGATPTVVVTPTSGTIPPPGATPAAPASSPGILDWLQGSMIGGIPNWVVVGAGALLLFGGKHK